MHEMSKISPSTSHRPRENIKNHPSMTGYDFRSIIINRTYFNGIAGPRTRPKIAIRQTLEIARG
jgi:hypothetical protein